MNIAILQIALGATTSDPNAAILIEAIVLGLVIFPLAIVFRVWVHRHFFRRYEGRTIRQLVTTENIWDKVDLWASETRYKIMEQENSSRLYQRYELFIGTQTIKVTQATGSYVFEVWVIPTRSRRFLGFTPDEVRISGFFLGEVYLLTHELRKDFNRLLSSVGIPLVEQ